MAKPNRAGFLARYPAHLDRFRYNRSDLEFDLKAAGARLVTEKMNRGEWNEHTIYSAITADGRAIVLDMPSKGERRDWLRMAEEFDRLSAGD